MEIWLMKTTNLLRSIKIMQFEKMYDSWNHGRITAEEAAELLGMSSRNFRRWCRSYEAEGAQGLADKRLERPSNRAAPVDEVTQMLTLFETRYNDFNIRHFHEYLLTKHNFTRSYNWVRNQLHHAGIVAKKKKRGPYKKQRERKPLPGMMLHQDGSSHEWVEDCFWDLIITLDDATTEIYSGFFVEEEGTMSSFRAIKEVILKKGLFCSLYTDRGSHYWHTPEVGGKVNKENTTQVHRALKHLGIELIPAYSPEARGRSERAFGTIQGRLPQELRLAGIKTMEEANKYLKKVFIPNFNKLFTVKPAVEDSAFVPWFDTQNIDDILCLKNTRTVNKDNTVHYNNKTLQLPKIPPLYNYAKTKVNVHEYENSTLAVFHGPKCLARYTSDGSLINNQEEKEPKVFHYK